MKTYEKILHELEKALELLELEVDDILLTAERGIKYSKQALKEIRNIVIEYSFEDNKEEINFFKTVKPKVYGKLIYYVKLFNIESKHPRSSRKSQIKYLNKQIDKLQNYFNENLDFYYYYRCGASFLDEQYFLRGKSDIRLHPDTFHFFIDDEFSTSHDSSVATILAYDMLITHLKNEIIKLENNNTSCIIPSNSKTSKLYWTANKTDLIELIYALDSVGAINSGSADIKKMAIASEQFFNIELGDFYRTYLEIRSRKTNQTKFLDKLKESLLIRMENADE